MIPEVSKCIACTNIEYVLCIFTFMQCVMFVAVHCSISRLSILKKAKDPNPFVLLSEVAQMFVVRTGHQFTVVSHHATPHYQLSNM